MCPSYLDGDHALGQTPERRSAEHAVIPVCWHGCAVFKVRKEAQRPDWALGLSKLNSMGRASELERPQVRSTFQEPLRSPSAHEVPGLRSCAGAVCAGRHERPLQSWSFLRKEVIQPHLPVRLPCYDFTPVTSPTFDGSLPEGLGHRLRVLLASVV